MYRPISPLQRIDEQAIIYPSQLYEPLRKSLLRTNLSQSNISSRSNLSNSRVNDLSTSRVSRRMRSLSPQEAQQIKSNTFIPINKRLVPTRNLYLVKDKKFQAIDMQERVHKAIPAIRFNSINRFNANKVQEIVYQTEEQANQPHYRRDYQPEPINANFGPSIRQAPINQQANIYTSRNNNFMNSNPNFGVSRVREYSPREAYNMGMDARPMLETFGNRDVPPPPSQYHQTVFQSNVINSQPSYNPMTSINSFQQNRNITSFEQSPPYNSPTFPTITPSNLNNSPQPPNLYTSQCNQQIRQLPTQNTLSFLASPLGSNASFQPQLQKPPSQLNKSYDFSKLTQDSSTSQYQQKKKQEWKYNLFSVFDEPLNTKCSKTGCFKNEIIASRPNLYEWQQ